MENRSMTAPKSGPNSGTATGAAVIAPPCTAISATSKPPQEIRSGKRLLEPMHAPISPVSESTSPHVRDEGPARPGPKKKIVKKVVKKIVKRKVPKTNQGSSPDSTQGNASVQEAVIGEKGTDLSGHYPVEIEPLRIEGARVRHEPIIVEKAVPIIETKETKTNTTTKHRSQDSLVENRNVGPVGDKSVVLARGKGESSNDVLNYGVRFNEREEVGVVERKKQRKTEIFSRVNASVQEAVIGEKGNDRSGNCPVEIEPSRIEGARVRHEPIIVEKAAPVMETKETRTNTITKHRSQDSLVENRNVGPVGDKSVVLARGKGESSNGVLNYGVRFNEREEVGVVERKKQSKTEIFVGGLPNHADRHDIRKVFRKAVEVKLMMDYKTGRNKGYAFVRFATPADAANAVVNSKVEIRGKMCDVAPVAGNDTLFLWNLDKNWKAEDVQALLEKSCISQIGKITVKDERGFAFVEFETCQAAHYAMNKMGRIDVFGIFPRVQVKWAECLTEPEEHELSNVKTVYAEFLPLSWKRDKVEEYFKRFGDIEDIVLAEELPSSRRLDYAFITYTTREAALTCVEAVRREISEDCSSKVKFAVSLAKPFPKPNSKRTKYTDAPPVRQQCSNNLHETNQHMPSLPRTGIDAPNRHFLLPIKKRPISFVEEDPLYIQQHNLSYIQEGRPISGLRQRNELLTMETPIHTMDIDESNM